MLRPNTRRSLSRNPTHHLSPDFRMWARAAMCQSADCQLVLAGNALAGARENKENFDWNNNNQNNNNNGGMFGNELGVSNNALRDERCQCMMQRRTR